MSDTEGIEAYNSLAEGMRDYLLKRIEDLDVVYNYETAEAVETELTDMLAELVRLVGGAGV